MKKQGEKIPTIRKQYVQTIFDGLKTQFDQTTKQQLLDQIDKVETLQSVYQQSFRAQSSIVEFLAKMCKDKQNTQYPLFKELSQQLEELEQQNNQQRKSIIIQNLSGKVGEASEIINLLNTSLNQVKNQNMLLTEQFQKLCEEKQTQKKCYEEKIAQLMLMQEKYKISLEEKQKKLLQSDSRIQQLQRTNLDEQNNLRKLLQEQNNEKVRQIQQRSQVQRLKLLEIIKKYQEESLAKDQEKVKLQASLLTLTNQNTELAIFKQQNENLIKSLQQQLEIILKFSNYEQKKTQKIKKKISDRQLINKDQLQKLEEFSQRENQKTQNLKQLQQCFDSILPVSYEKNVVLEKITERQEEHCSSNSIVSQSSRKNEESKEHSKTEQQIKQDSGPRLSKSETTGKLLNKQRTDSGFLAVRHCQSQNNSNSDDDEKAIQQEITQLKEQFEKKVSVLEQSFEDEKQCQANTKQDNLGSKQNQFLIIEKRQSQRTSAIIQRLQQSHITTNIYYQKLEQQNEILNKRLEMEKTHFKDQIDEHNDRIDELMNKIQQLEEQRIRGLNSLENYEATLFEKNHEVDILCNEVQKLREENNQFAEMCQKSKADLEGQKRKVENLQDQIRQLNTQKEKFSKEKSRLDEQMTYQNQKRKDLEEELEKKQQQLASKILEIEKLRKNLSITGQKLSESQQIILELQGTVLGYQKCIDQLESKIQAKNEQERNYLDEIERLKRIISELAQKLSAVQKNLQEKQDQLDQVQHELKIMHKNNQDLKYMNEILKKDVMRIKEIEAYDWEKQCEQTPTNLKGSKIIRVSTIKEQPESTTRSKNHSYTGPTNPPVLAQQFKNHQLPLKVHPKENTTQNFPVSKINFSKEPKLNLKFDIDLDTKQGINFSKTYKQNLYLTERSERPLTDIIKKKYML